MNRHAPGFSNFLSPSAWIRLYRAAHPRTRTVALIGLFLTVHWLALMVLLSVAQSAGAETEARLATQPWAFSQHPGAVQATGHTHAKSQVLQANRQASQDDWTAVAKHKDTAAPWTYDPSGHVVWK